MKRTALLLFAVLSLADALHAQAPSESAFPRAKVDAAIEAGLKFLASKQDAAGYWTSGDYPGLTGLIIQSALASPGGKHRGDEAVRKGLDFIRKSARPDGGIYAERLGNYNTSVCLATLLLANDPKDAAIIDGAHNYLVGAQTKDSANPANDGGFGYESGGSGRQTRPDLDNTLFALEALARYRDAHKSQETPAKDLNWQAAIDFVARCQQGAAPAKDAKAAESADDKGGFAYTPDGGSETRAAVEQSLRSYGSMTYAGVLSFIYADLKKDDPRVQSALDWISRHYTLEENPGQGAQGLYYYYNLMSKGLTAAGIDKLKVSSGADVDWRKNLAEKLLALQKPDGSWSSENGRWMEKDPNLVTAYCLLALDLVGAGN